VKEIPTKPYLLRALFEWCVDNGYTPYLYVSVDANTQVPAEYVKEGQIVLNIGPHAVHKLQMGNELIEFTARFGGVPRQISIPVGNVQALRTYETGRGYSFEAEDARPTEPHSEKQTASNTRPPALPAPVPEPPKKPSGGGKPTLRRIK
jgi:stringent starvation protein B